MGFPGILATIPVPLDMISILMGSNYAHHGMPENRAASDERLRNRKEITAPA